MCAGAVALRQLWAGWHKPTHRKARQVKLSSRHEPRSVLPETYDQAPLGCERHLQERMQPAARERSGGAGATCVAP